MFSLRFDPKEIPLWASLYPIVDDQEVEESITPKVRKRGYFLKPELLIVCNWKTHRSKSRVAKNLTGFVEEVTKTAFSTPDERLRVEVLTLLDGVEWPTASVLLHFGHSDPYPILDFRALWSLGLPTPPKEYDYVFWREYTQYCRRLATNNAVSIRTLDRALWQYSKKNQKGKS